MVDDVVMQEELDVRQPSTVRRMSQMYRPQSAMTEMMTYTHLLFGCGENVVGTVSLQATRCHVGALVSEVVYMADAWGLDWVELESS